MTIYDWLKEKGIVTDSSLIDEAFTHTSYVNEHKKGNHDNERLEFMGDAVMQIWVSERLFALKPEISEGDMSKMRANTVCEKSFAGFMREMGLPKYLKLGVGEEKSGGRDRDSILADAFEAFVGALYLSCGMKAVDTVLDPVVTQTLEKRQKMETMDYKTQLQEYVQADIRKAVKYTLLSEQGPSNNPVFEMGVYMDGILMGTGTGHNKKQAEQNAAKEALNKLVK